jgi:predicted DNA-binding protein with PD1-like motif
VVAERKPQKFDTFPGLDWLLFLTMPAPGRAELTMKTPKNTLLLFLIGSGLVFTQETRRDVVSPSRIPAEDTRPNSDKVPDAYSINGHFDRIAIMRFKYDTDLLAGMNKMVKQEKIRNAVILAAVGSVRGYQVHHVTNRNFPSRDTFVKNPTAPADLIGMNGYIVDGRIHAHMTLANPDKAFGGHLEPGTKVFTFAIVTVGVLNNGVDLSRIDDETYR